MCTVDCRPVLSETCSIYSFRIGDVFQLHPLMQIPPGMIRRVDHFRERGSMSRDQYTTCCTSMESQGDMLTSSAFLPLPICWSITGQRKALWELSFSLCSFFFSGTRPYHSLKWVQEKAGFSQTLGNLMMEITVAGMLQSAQWMDLSVSLAGESPSQPSDGQCWKHPEEQPGWH